MANANRNVIFRFSDTLNVGLEIEMTEWDALATEGRFYLLRTMLVNPGSQDVTFADVEYHNEFSSQWEAKVFVEMRLVQTLEWIEKNGFPTQQEAAKKALGRVSFIQGMAIGSFPDYNSQRKS